MPEQGAPCPADHNTPYRYDAGTLAALPWPKHLVKVPEFAGGHHERMDAKGYPRGLTREQMSVQARCMGIADIFEALTILGKFKINGHIDPDLFDVFMWEKIYEKYAKQFLDPAAIPGYVLPPEQRTA